MTGTTARAMRRTEPALNSIIWRNTSSGVSCTGSPMWKPPAILHSTSMRPNRARASSTAAATAAPSPRSAATMEPRLALRAIGRFERGRLEVEQRQARSLRRERRRDGAAETACRAGDHRNLAVETRYAHIRSPRAPPRPMRGEIGRLCQAGRAPHRRQNARQRAAAFDPPPRHCAELAAQLPVEHGDGRVGRIAAPLVEPRRHHLARRLEPDAGEGHAGVGRHQRGRPALARVEEGRVENDADAGAEDARRLVLQSGIDLACPWRGYRRWRGSCVSGAQVEQRLAHHVAAQDARARHRRAGRARAPGRRSICRCRCVRRWR